jgi:hypothetical protein
MLLKTACRSWLLRGLLALVACGDFTLVEPQPEGPALNIHVDAVSDQSTRYDLNAAFRRGTDARGRPTEIVDRALYVEGTPVLPGPETQPGIWFYRWQETRTTTGDPASLVRVTFPVIAGSSTPAHFITIPITQRTDPADVDLGRGNDLVLHLALANRVTTGLSGGVDFWRLDIRETCSGIDSGPQFTITGTGPHPSELHVPWQWLETLVTGPMSACLQAHSSFEVAGSPYPAFVSVSVRLVWRIRIVVPG